MTRRARRAASAVALTGLLVALSPAAAYAGEDRLLLDVAGDAAGLGPAASSAPLTFDKLAPGTSASGAVSVMNDSPYAAELHLRAVGLRDDDNACLAQELRDGDTTCGAGGGELGEWFTLSISPHGPGTASAATWTGTVDDLTAGAVLVERIPPRGVVRLELTGGLPDAAGNDTMTDRIAWDLRWTLTAGDRSVVAEGPGVTGPGGAAGGVPTGLTGGPGSAAGSLTDPGAGVPAGSVLGAAVVPSTGVLPSTGSPLDGWVIALGGALLAAGAALLAGSRRRRRPGGAQRSGGHGGPTVQPG